MNRVGWCVLFAALLAGVLAITLRSTRTSPDAAGKLGQTIVIYDHETIPAGKALAQARYTKVDGYRHVNIFVEFEQNSPEEKPLSLGVVFAHDERGKWGARRYYNFGENLRAASANIQVRAGARQSVPVPEYQFDKKLEQDLMDQQVIIAQGTQEPAPEEVVEQKATSVPGDPQMITLSGAGSWHGSPHNRSSYIARLPVMGPYLQVFPFNHHDEERIFSIVLYLTK
jgi:hypothetical protein